LRRKLPNLGKKRIVERIDSEPSRVTNPKTGTRCFTSRIREPAFWRNFMKYAMLTAAVLGGLLLSEAAAKAQGIVIGAGGPRLGVGVGIGVGPGYYPYPAPAYVAPPVAYAPAPAYVAPGPAVVGPAVAVGLPPVSIGVGVPAFRPGPFYYGGYRPYYHHHFYR
jgi:hypothetical protein